MKPWKSKSSEAGQVSARLALKVRGKNMREIAIVGKGDKRLFVYPLLNICKDAKRTCLITDDVSYKRLYSGYDNTEQIAENVEINVISVMSDSPSDESLAQLKELKEEKQEDDFDLILYVFDGYLPEGCEKAIGVLTQTKTFLGWSLDFFHEQNKEVEFAMMTMYRSDKTNAVKLHTFPWKMKHMLYLSRVEEFKMLQGINDKGINEFLANTFCESLDLSKEEFLKLANKKPTFS